MSKRAREPVEEGGGDDDDFLDDMLGTGLKSKPAEELKPVQAPTVMVTRQAARAAAAAGPAVATPDPAPAPVEVLILYTFYLIYSSVVLWRCGVFVVGASLGSTSESTLPFPFAIFRLSPLSFQYIHLPF